MTNRYTKTMPDKDRMMALYDCGMTQNEVAEEMGLTQKIVWRCLRDYGVECRKDAPRNQRGDKNNNWKGSNATYAAFHARIKKLKGKPMLCEECGTTDKNRTYDWANLTGKYDDVNDYKRMCRHCHWIHDQKYLNLKEYARKRNV